MRFFRRDLKSKKGQGLTEYGIILVLVAVAAIGVFALFGGTIRNKIAQVTEAVSGDTTKYDAAVSKTKEAAEKAETIMGKDVDMGGGTAADLKLKAD